MKRTSFSCSLVFSQDKISSMRPSTNAARGRLISGVSIEPRLIHKLVKPRKVVRSRSADKMGIDKLSIAKAQPEINAGRTDVLRVADAAVRWKLRCFDLCDGCGYESAIFLALLFSNGSPQILN